MIAIKFSLYLSSIATCVSANFVDPSNLATMNHLKRVACEAKHGLKLPDFHVPPLQF